MILNQPIFNGSNLKCQNVTFNTDKNKLIEILKSKKNVLNLKNET